MACKRPQLEPREASQSKHVNELGLWINGWVYLILRVCAGSRSFRGVEAVFRGSEKPPLLDSTYDTYVPSRVPGELRGVYHNAFPISGHFSAKWKEIEVALTPDMHDTVSVKRVERPVGTREQ